MAERQANYLDPAAVARLGSLSLGARTVVEGFITGLHHSPFKGFSLEFAQHRQYTPGDALKHLDWKVYARNDHYVVRQYEEETNMRCYLAVDTSSSMTFRHAGAMSKLDYASYLAASLAYLMLHQQDSVGLVLMDDTIRRMIPPRSAKGHINHLLEALENKESHRSHILYKALNDLGKRIQKRHLLIIISDLLEDPGELIKAIRYFQYHKHEVIVMQILDPSEQDLPFKGPVLFKGLEDDDHFQTEPETIGHDYRKLMNAMLKQYEREFRQSGIDYCLMNTAQPFDVALGSYLTKRQNK